MPAAFPRSAWSAERSDPVSLGIEYAALVEAIFLSHSFRAEDRDLAAAVEAVIDSYGIRVFTGRHLGGEQFGPKIMARIDECDALVAVATPRDLLQNGRYTAPQWILDELAHARAKGKSSLAIVHRDVDLAGVATQHERADYDPGAALPALVKLSQTLGMWKRQHGKRLKVLLLPEEVAARVKNAKFSCEYRYARDGNATPWQRATGLREPGGTYAYLVGAPDDALIEVRVRDGAKSWASRAAPQWLHIEVS